MTSLLDSTYKFIRFITDKIIGYGAAFVMLATTGLALTEIFRRYVLGVVFDWGQDAVTYFMVGAICLFFAVTQARRSHLAMTAFMDWLKARGYVKSVLLIRLVNSLLMMLFCSYFVITGLPSAERVYMMGRTTQSMMLKVWPFQYALLAAFALMAIISLFQLYQDYQALRGKLVFSWAENKEGIEI